MVDRLDQGVGRILAALAETGAAENTVIFFSRTTAATPISPFATTLSIPGWN